MLNYINYLNARRLEKKQKWKPALAIYKNIAEDQSQFSAQLAYRIGFAAEKIKDWKTAEIWLNKAVEADPSKAQWFYRLALAQELNKKFSLAAETYAQATALQPKNPKYLHRLGKVLWITGKGAEAEEHLQKAIELEPKNPAYAYELVMAIRKQGRTWQEVEALQAALALDGSNAQWQFELGEAQDKMNRYAAAAQAFGKANQLQPGNAMWHFREGYAWERASEYQQAQLAYTEAIAADKELNAKNFGIGVFHQKRGYWPQAAQAYADSAQQDPANAELQYRLGMAHDRCYRWDKAADCYRQALFYEPHKPDWHYRLGFVLERQGLWEKSAQAYAYAATTRPTHTPYWFYRLGYVLAEGGRHEEACAAFLRTRTQAELDAQPQPHQAGATEMQTALSTSYLDSLKANLRDMQAQGTVLRSHDPAAAFYKLGNQAERLQMWEEAAKAYQQAIARSNDHKSTLYYRLGYVLMRINKFELAAEAFIETIIFKRPHAINTDIYKKPSFLKLSATYVEYIDTLPILDNVILYESTAGSSIGCNPYAIYEFVKNDDRFKDFLHVWVINDKNIDNDNINTVFVSRGSDLYLRYLAQSKYLINNNTFPQYFMRREGQFYLNTWHGTPLKTLGKKIKGGFMEHANATRNFLQATHIISPNRHTTDVIINDYDIDNIFSGKFAETGYPRIDRTINSSEEKKNKILHRLNASDDEKIILYAPTWRGTLNDIQFDKEQLLEDLESMQVPGGKIYFRGHHMFEKRLSTLSVNVTVVPSDIDTNELLSVVDILITDYSSIFFDYFPLNRPIIYYAYDLESYKSDRGLYFDLNDLPGDICYKREDLYSTIENRIKNPVLIGDVESARRKYFPLEDGCATKRVVDFLFFDKSNHLFEMKKTNKKKIIFYQGQFIPNGITSSFLNLVYNLDVNKYDITLVVDPSAIDINFDRLNKFNQIPKNIRVLPRIGSTMFSVEEKWVSDKYEMFPGLLNNEQMDFHKRIYQREYHRIFGDATFDIFINFEGYVRFWAYIFSYQKNENNRNIIYLHNDVFSECETRFPYLNSIFNIYHNYDKLISVSKSVHLENKNKLFRKNNLESAVFDYCNNCIDVDSIISKSKEPLDQDLDLWIGSSENVFVTLGRLSPEKDHKKLINAFSMVLKEINSAKLVILGDGPLKSVLQNQIESLNLEENILLGGLRANPFPMLARSKCFVFSSNYEGQGLVVLEALVLGCPVISTDVVGPRSILENGEGILVENSSTALAKAMLSFIQDGKWKSTFDYQRYMDDAIARFESILK